MNNITAGAVMRETILYFIIRYAKEHGYPPTVREIGEGVGLRSSASVHRHMKRMKEGGMIGYIDGEPRTITVQGYGFGRLTQKEEDDHG